jgi:hypothetical protein
VGSLADPGTRGTSDQIFGIVFSDRRVLSQPISSLDKALGRDCAALLEVGFTQ